MKIMEVLFILIVLYMFITITDIGKNIQESFNVSIPQLFTIYDSNLNVTCDCNMSDTNETI